MVATRTHRESRAMRSSAGTGDELTGDPCRGMKGAGKGQEREMSWEERGGKGA